MYEAEIQTHKQAECLQGHDVSGIIMKVKQFPAQGDQCSWSTDNTLYLALEI